MNASDVIAVFALLVSLGSAWISYRAHRHSIGVKEQASRLAFSREKSEFLVRIDKARKLFDSLERRIKTLLDSVKNLPDGVRSRLEAETDQLRADLEYLGGCQRQALALWADAYEMNHPGLAHHKPHFLKLIEDDERFAIEALARCDRAEGAMK